MTSIGGVARRYVVTLALAVVVLVVALATGSIRDIPDWASLHPSGPPAVVPALVAPLLADGPSGLLLALLGIAAVVGPSERLLGPWRTAVVYLASGALGAFAAALLAPVVVSGSATTGGPLGAVVGTALAASAFAERLWRRRIRIVGLGVLLVLVLYSGAVPDFARLAAGFVGLGLGIALSPMPRSHVGFTRSSRHEARTLLAILTLAVAAGPVVTLLDPAARGPLHTLGVLLDESAAHEPGACGNAVATAQCVASLGVLRAGDPGAILLSLLPLAVLALAAIGMLRGRRVAVWIAVGVLGLFAYLAAFYYGALRLFPDGGQLAVPDPGAASIDAALAIVVPAALAGVLLANLGHFPGRASSRTLRRFWIAVGGAFLATSLAYLLIGFAVSHEFSPPVTFLSLLLDLPERYFPVGFLHLRRFEFVPVGAVASLLFHWVGPVFWATVLVAGGYAMAGSAGGSRPSDHDRVRALLHEGASGSLAHMATWQGHSYWFDRDDGSAVAYRVVSGVAITTGGPVGPPERRAAAVRGFIAHCDENGWVPAFYSIDDELLPVFDELGWHSAVIGDDAVITPSSFTLAGGRWKDIRTSINRASKLGVVAQWTTWTELGLGARSQIEAISEEWVAGRNLPEMGFTLGGVDELADPEVRLMIAVDENGVVLAATSWMPTYRHGAIVGWTLDFMRRRTDSMNGVVEFLIAETVSRAKLDGIEFVSLAAAPLARAVTGHGDAGPADHVLGYVGRRLEGLYGFRSLLAFKLKFAPRFRPLSIAYPDPLVLPTIGIALARAYLPSMTVGQAVSIARAMVRAEDVARRSSERMPVG